MEICVEQVSRRVCSAGRLTEQNDARRIAAKTFRVAARPGDGAGDVLRARWPGMRRGEAIVGNDGQDAVTGKIVAEIDVEDAVDVLVAGDEATARDVDEYVLSGAR